MEKIKILGLNRTNYALLLPEKKIKSKDSFHLYMTVCICKMCTFQKYSISIFFYSSVTNEMERFEPNAYTAKSKF